MVSARKRIFVSWTGARGQAVAESLHQNMRIVLPSIEPWLSSEDISAGRRWFDELNGALQTAEMGIVVLTPESLASPWVLFEAGYIFARTSGRVIPYLSGLKPGDLNESPYQVLQCAEATESGTWQLFEAINDYLLASGQESPQLRQGFELLWPRLKQQIAEAELIPSSADARRTTIDVHPLGVGIAVVQRASDLLMTRRRGGSGLTWTFPAVIYHPEDRTPGAFIERVVSNVRQETGVECRCRHHLGSRPSFLPGHSTVLDYYYCEYLYGEATNLDPDENREVVWVNAAHVNLYVTSDVFEPVQALIDQIAAGDSTSDGPHPRQLVVVGLAVHQRRVLAVKRTVPEGELVWSLPGGRLKPGESETDAVVREIAEETGLTCRVTRPIGSRIHPTTGADMAYYLCSYSDGTISIAPDEPLDTVGWLTPAEFRDAVTSPILPGIEEILDRIEAGRPLD